MRLEAEAHAVQKNWAAAIGSFKALLGLTPDNPEVLLQLSYMESLAGHYRQGRAYALEAARHRGSSMSVVGELVSRLRTFNEVQEVRKILEGLPHVSKLPIPLLVNLGAQLSYMNQQEEALRFLDEARRGDPEFPPTLLARAQILIYLGRFEEAKLDLSRCMARAPNIPKVYWLLSRLEKATSSSNHVSKIQQLLMRPNQSADEVALLGYALHKELEDLGDYPGAWRALEFACKAKRSSIQYQAEDSHHLVSRLMSLSVLQPPASTAARLRIPIFIVGMHRSGTTLLEQLLDGHDDVRGIGELYDFTCQMREATDHHCRGVLDVEIVERAAAVNLSAVGEAYLQGVEWRLGKERYFTDKLPSNFLNIGFICQALPEARILHMVRDPVETCFSNLRELFGETNAYSYDQIELADYHRQYQRLMEHWRDSFPGRILDVSYSQLTQNPEETLRRVAGFCGFSYQPTMLDSSMRSRAVATASAIQVRQGVSARETPKWEPYRQWLQPMVARLQS